MKGKLKYFGFALLGALLALTSCRDLGLKPVFYALSQEQPLTDERGFPDEISVGRILKAGGAGGRYFATASRLYTRLDGASDNWTVVAPPASLTNGMVGSLEFFNTQIYASFIDRDTGDGLGLFRTDPDPIIWEQIADFGGAVPSQITMLKAAGGELFVTIATWTGTATEGHFEYSLSHSATGNTTSYAVISGAGWGATPPAATLPILDVASDGNFYWVIVFNSLYRDDGIAGVGAFDQLTAPALSGNYRYGGLLYNGATSTLYLSATNGFLHSSTTDGDSWSSSAEFLNADNKPIPFATFGLPAVDTDAVYVGTGGYVGGYGYYWIPSGDVTGTSGDISRTRAFNITAIYDGVLNCLFYDPNTTQLFLCTSGDGLWRGTYQGTTGDWSWRQE